MQLTKLKLFCMNYFCVLLDRPKRPWPSVAARWILKIGWITLPWTIDAQGFKFALLGTLSSLLFIKMFKNSSHQISKESVHVFDLPKTVFHSMASFDHFQNQLSKSGKVYSEAVHRKLTLKVPSTNICNKTCWHRSPSVCDDASEVHSHFALFIVVWPFNEEANPGDYQIGLLVFQTSEASRVHVYTHLAVFFLAEMWMSSWSPWVLLLSFCFSLVLFCFIQ